MENNVSYQDEFNQQLNDLHSPQRAMEILRDMATRIGGYSKPTASFNAKHPIINALMGAGTGALIGKIAGGDSKDVLTAMALGGASGFSRSQNARRNWENKINDQNLEVAKTLMTQFGPQNKAKILNSLLKPAQAVGQDQFAKNTLDEGGFDYMSPQTGLMGKDTTQQAFDIAGNTQTANSLKDFTNNMINSDNKGFATMSGMKPNVNNNNSQQPIQNNQKFNNLIRMYRQSKGDIEALGGYDNVKKDINDNSIVDVDRQGMKTLIDKHQKLYSQMQQNGLLNKENNPTSIQGELTHSTPAFIPTKDQINMAEDVYGAYHDGRKLGNDYRHDITTEGETHRKNVVGEGLDRVKTNSYVRKNNVSINKTNTEIDKLKNPEKYKDPNTTTQKRKSDLRDIKASLQSYGGYKADASDLHANYILDADKYTPAQRAKLRQAIINKTGVDPEGSYKFLKKPSKNDDNSQSSTAKAIQDWAKED